MELDCLHDFTIYIHIYIYMDIKLIDIKRTDATCENGNKKAQITILRETEMLRLTLQKKKVFHYELLQ